VAASRSVLVTGGGGFAGRHLIQRLGHEGVEPEAPDSARLDLLDAGAVRRAVAATRPDVVFHLAARSSVGATLAHPAEVLRVNVGMTANLLEAVREEAPGAHLVLVSSGEIYGRPDELPVDEDAQLRPRNPYAVSKASCDLLGAQYAEAHGLAVTRMRAFNHAGPGQGDDFVVGTLTKQVAEAEADGRRELTLRTGNLDSARDFTDVRDVVRAYAQAPPLAGAFNVCSGTATTVRQLVEMLRGHSHLEIACEVDPARLRAGEVPEVRGCARRLHDATGWEPEIPLDRTVGDALESWRRRLASAR
jgi:GDP-4-dehydro-6-deoxy-D-mannose reductase